MFYHHGDFINTFENPFEWDFSRENDSQGGKNRRAAAAATLKFHKLRSNPSSVIGVVNQQQIVGDCSLPEIITFWLI